MNKTEQSELLKIKEFLESLLESLSRKELLYFKDRFEKLMIENSYSGLLDSFNKDTKK